MDLLQRCAAAFERLTSYQYRFTLGRRGKLKEIVLGFNQTDFHHLVGIHKLKDINIARDNRQKVFRGILGGVYFCRSFFPMDKRDYTKEQMQYTLLKKEKINLQTGEITARYDRLTPKSLT